MLPGAPPARVSAVADVLEAALIAAGWQRIVTQPSPDSPSGTQFARGNWSVDFRARLAAVATYVLSAEQWQEGCRVAGIGTLQIALPEAAPVPPPTVAPAPAFSSPVPTSDPPATGLLRRVPLWLAFALIVLILGALGWMLRSPQSPIRPPSGDKLGKRTYVTADGRSNLAGDLATGTYELTGHDWEAVYAPNNVNGVGDGAQWWVGQFLPSTKLSMGISMRFLRPAIEDKATENRWLSYQEDVISSQAASGWKTSTTKIDGRPAYAWEFVDRGGQWVRDVHLIGSLHSFRFNCMAERPSAADLKLAKSRCTEFLDSVRLHVKD
jgi:hypothetical protein